MQILTEQTKQGASISGRRKVQQGEGSDWEIRSALPSSVEKVDQTGHLLASLMDVPIETGSWRTNILVG